MLHVMAILFNFIIFEQVLNSCICLLLTRYLLGYVRQKIYCCSILLLTYGLPFRFVMNGFAHHCMSILPLFKGTQSWFPGTKVQMAGSEPLIQEADPHITKLAIEARM